MVNESEHQKWKWPPEKGFTFTSKGVPPKLPPKKWIARIFEAKAAKNGGIVRRKIQHVHKYASRNALEKEVKRRRFHMVISGDQYIILCHPGEFKVIC